MYYLHFKNASSSKDALIVNNIVMATVTTMMFFVLIRKKVYCIYKGKIYSQGVIINNVIT